MEVKNNIGKGEAKELICMTHRLELRAGEYWREGDARGRCIKGKKRDNCNRIINKIYLKRFGTINFI